MKKIFEFQHWTVQIMKSHQKINRKQINTAREQLHFTEFYKYCHEI